MDSEIIYHNTSPVLEYMMEKYPKLHIAFRYLNIISVREGRFMSANCHRELDPLLGMFNRDISLVSVVGNFMVTALIEIPDKCDKSRIHPIIYVIGDQCRVERHSWSLMVDELNSYINLNEFLPDPFCRKVIYLKNWDDINIDGFALSEVGKGLWTISDPMKLPLKNCSKTGTKEIINSIILDIKEGQ